MDAIDLALPDFLRAANRKPLLQTQKRCSEPTSIMPKSVGGKSKRRRTKELTEAEVRNDH